MPLKMWTFGIEEQTCLRNCHGQFRTSNFGDLTEDNSSDHLKCGTLAKQEGSTHSFLLDILVLCGSKSNLLGQGEEPGGSLNLPAQNSCQIDPVDDDRRQEC